VLIMWSSSMPMMTLAAAGLLALGIVGGSS
jgi:hypothetical protein